MVHPTKLEFNTIIEHFIGQRLPGRPRQYPYTESSAQNYKVGSRMQLPDGTVWHYSQVTIEHGEEHKHRGLVSDVTSETLAVSGTHAIGVSVITITDTNEDHGANYWRGGKVELWSAISQHRIIVGSTASNGTTCTITLNRPLTSAAADAIGLEICRSPYASIIPSFPNHHMSCYGIPMMGVTVDHFIWLQTWGLCTVASAEAEHPLGAAVDSRELYFYFNGAFLVAEANAYTAGMQCVGFVLPDTVGGEETLAFLRLDP